VCERFFVTPIPREPKFLPRMANHKFTKTQSHKRFLLVSP
jgi:hypothetical protein